MKQFIPTSVFALIVLISLVARHEESDAAESAAPSASEMNYVDLFYDFDFYAGQPRFGWVIVWEADDGTLFEWGPFDSAQEASFEASFAFGNKTVSIEGHHQRVRIVDYEIVYKELEPIMEYIATYDTLAEAESAANYFEMYGYYTEIDFVSVYQYGAN